MTPSSPVFRLKCDDGLAFAVGFPDCMTKAIQPELGRSLTEMLSERFPDSAVTVVVPPI